MVKSKPLIGVTEPDKGGLLSWFCIRSALYFAGAKAIKLTAAKPHTGLQLDGLIIAGGSDINPHLYNSPTALTEFYDDDRDRLEQAWFHTMYSKGKPILGICRGAQMINVCLGGDLYASIRLICEEAHYPRTIWTKVFARKPIAVLPSSCIASLVKKPICWVNSIHQQSVKNLGAGLSITAKEHNGIVQAIEAPAYPFLLGVQWHPEYMLNNGRQRRIFTAFVQAARRVKADT
jgi:putative glutamine amidotransferase